MASPGLHEALRTFAVELGALLTRELEADAELPFELEETGVADRPGGRAGPVLYHYRPLTAAFIAGHWDAARELPGYRTAVEALTPGAAAYLRQRGRLGWEADEALRDLLERLFHDATAFDLPEDRFGRLCEELDAELQAETVRAAVVAPIHGVRIASARVELGADLALVRRSAIDPPPAALEGAARAPELTAEVEEAADSVEPSPLDVFCVLERELPARASLPVDEARALFRRLLTALRLSGAGGSALGPLAWAHVEGGGWHMVALGLSARSRPESWELLPPDETEFRDLVDLLAVSRHGATVAWALDRFEMGCERALETEALSDYLLALRALLAEPEPTDPTAVARRLAVLCAPAPERDAMRARIALALALERRLMWGAGGDEAPALDSPHALVREVERHLRALLRDVLCGYLDPDLRSAADAMLAAAGAAAGANEITVRDMRQGSEAGAAPLEEEPLEATVTPSIDWAPDDWKEPATQPGSRARDDRPAFGDPGSGAPRE